MKTLQKICILFIIVMILTACAPGAAMPVNTEYVLTTATRADKFVFLGVDGDINGVVNPALHANPGEAITVTLVNGGEGTHDIVFPTLNVHSNTISKRGETTSVTFSAPTQDAALDYYDSSHENLGMKGVLLVGKASLAEQPTAAAAAVSATAPAAVSNAQTVEFSLESGLADGKMVFTGKGGAIDGKTNPDLKVDLGAKVKITLFSGEGAQHNVNIDELSVKSADVTGKGNSITVEFTAGKEGTFAYYCSIPGHRQAGMEGKFIVGSGAAAPQAAGAMPGMSNPAPQAAAVSAGPADPSAVDITRDPTDLPAPIGKRGPQNVRVDLTTMEVVGKLADGTTYHYWTFNGKVPGPMIRVRVGDTVELHLKNQADSTMVHSIDLHAVTGPGGGAVMTQTQPGAETVFTFKTLIPGLFVYHCATPMVADHISNGMYGMILVEPEGGLPKVDREFYVMQGEVYTTEPFGTQGALTNDINKLLDEKPEYFVFNGASMALASDAHALRAKVGETVRIFFGVGGPNFTSSFHVIGEMFDRVYNLGSVTDTPLTDVQTTLVPPGGSTIVEISLQVPGRYILVDHALSRMQRGLAGYLYATGDPAPDIYKGTLTPGSGH